MLAIIPARSGSKRIPGKNIKDFLGQPIIGYTIKNAVKSGVFNTVMVSTDSEDIASIARSYGAEVPFLRSQKTSNDTATTSEVILEVIECYQSRGLEFPWVACIYPFAALIQPQKILKAWQSLPKDQFTSLMTVVKYSHPIQRSLAVENSRARFIYPEFMSTRTQDLEPRYHDAGQFYFTQTATFKSTKSILTLDCMPFELSELECQDIDSLNDWKIAELKATLLGIKGTQ